MIPNKVILLYDNDTEIRCGPVGTQPIHFTTDPAWLADTLFLYGEKAEITVLVSEHDPHGKRFVKYGAELVPVNGNRQQVLSQRLPNLLENIRSAPPWLLMVISRDPALAGLLEAAAAHCVVMVYAPGDAVPKPYEEAAERARQRGQTLYTRLLSDLPFQPRQARVRFFNDAENMLGCYLERQVYPDPAEAHQALYEVTARYGKVSSMMYLADWHRVPLGDSFRDGLAGRDVETRQVDSRRGKGSTDHVLVAEVMKVLDDTDCLVIFSNDTDLRHLFYEARSRGVRVVSVGTRGKLTLDLQNAADEFVFLDDVLPSLRSPAVQPIEEMLQKIVVWVRDHNWKWISVEKLYKHLGSTPNDKLVLDEIIRAGYLVPGKKNPETSLEFNPAKLAI